MSSETPVKFSDLNLIEPLQLALKKAGYTIPTPIQVQAIPHLKEMLDREDEYLWIITVTLIVRLDPSRTDLLVGIRAAAKSEHPVVKEVARKFLRKR